MSMKHIFHGGTAPHPWTAGFPLAGRFYTVDDDDGALRFWRCTGNGGPDPSWANGFSEPGSNWSNQIGRGFESMLHMLGGDDEMLAIPPKR